MISSSALVVPASHGEYAFAANFGTQNREPIFASQRLPENADGWFAFPGQIVDDLEPWPNACILPNWTLAAVCCVPGGAFPSYAHGYYQRDNRFYQAWDAIARERHTFEQWIARHVMDTADFEDFRRIVEETSSPGVS